MSAAGPNYNDVAGQPPVRRLMVVRAKSYMVPMEVAETFDDLIRALQAVEQHHLKRNRDYGRNPMESETLRLVWGALAKVGMFEWGKRAERVK